MNLIRKISGIRGIVDKTLNDKVVFDHALAFSQLKVKGPILVARDTRSHGKHFSDIACKAISSAGLEVHNYGIIPTPTAQFLVSKNNFSGAIVITASHNPIEWNGMKFINSDGCFLNEKQNTKLFSKADNLQNVSKIQSGKISHIKDGFKDHINHTVNLSFIDQNRIKLKAFKVVVDAVNGAASYAVPHLLHLLKCEVIPLFCNPDGKFPHDPEPKNENLGLLSKSVIKNNADLGIAIDPDGDRLAIVDENGEPLGEENTLVIATDNFLSNGFKTTVVTNLSSSMALDNLAYKYSNPIKRSMVGEINVVEMMKEHNSSFGGEGNGGVILKESHLGRDAIVGIVMMLDWLSKKNTNLSLAKKDLPNYSIIKDKINLDQINPDAALQFLKKQFENEKIDLTDGLKIIWDNSWVHIRKSNTEPILRIYSEAKSESEAKNIIDQIKSNIKVF